MRINDLIIQICRKDRGEPPKAAREPIRGKTTQTLDKESKREPFWKGFEGVELSPKKKVFLAN